ncbi:MAG: hypothetical protein ACR2GQ_02420 [Gemmatimonadota bacterium]
MNVDDLRRFVLASLLFGICGVIAELLLLSHFEDWRQWFPLVLLGAGLPVATGVLLRPRAVSVRILRGLAAAWVPTGMLGAYFHFTGNLEFEREMDASVTGIRLLAESLAGAFPALAPGTMILLGLLGLAITKGHPALNGEET